jgi:hypothetical protein
LKRQITRAPEKSRASSRRRLFAAAALALLCLTAPAAQNLDSGIGLKVAQESIPLTSSFYRDMDALYLVSGAGTPSNDRPWTKAEASKILSRIDRARLDESMLPLFDSLAAVVAKDAKFPMRDGFGISPGLQVAVEAYAHDNGAEFDTEQDWVRGFEQRLPLLKASIDLSVGDLFYTYCDLQYGRNRFNYQDTLVRASDFSPQGIGAIVPAGATDAVLSTHSYLYSQGFLTNVIEHSYDFDFQWPKRAIASIGGLNWNVSLARDKINWGNAHSGDFIIDDHVDYQEFARFVLFTDQFKYDWLNVFLETNPTQGEGADSKFRMLMAHRLEFRILNRLTFAVSENVMYANADFDLRYLNPAFIYHNLNNRDMFNAIAHAELDYSFAKGFNLYAQFVMDQARAPNEGTSQGDSMGYLGGVEYARMAGTGVLSSSLEFALTTPLLYRRDKIDFLMFRKYFTHGDPGGPGYVLAIDYIGYPYGGDAMVLQWDTGYRLPGKASFDLKLFAMRHGEMNYFKSHNSGGDNNGFADYTGSTPSGDLLREILSASLSCEIELPRIIGWAPMRAWAELDWVGSRSYQKSTDLYSDQTADLQFTAGCSLSL